MFVDVEPASGCTVSQTRSMNGQRAHCWMMLIDTFLFFSSDEGSNVPSPTLVHPENH